MSEQAKETDTELFAAHMRNFSEISTGGGCTALYSEIDADSETYSLVTRNEGADVEPVAPKDWDDAVMFGYYVEGQMAFYRAFSSYRALLEWLDTTEHTLPTDDPTGWTRV